MSAPACPPAYLIYLFHMCASPELCASLAVDGVSFVDACEPLAN